MEAKYICGELPAAMGSCYGAIIFPVFMDHAQTARALGVEPTSAGMCLRDAEGKWSAYGKSQSLGIASKDGDEKHLNALGNLY